MLCNKKHKAQETCSSEKYAKNLSKRHIYYNAS